MRGPVSRDLEVWSRLIEMADHTRAISSHAADEGIATGRHVEANESVSESQGTDLGLDGDADSENR